MTDITTQVQDALFESEIRQKRSQAEKIRDNFMKGTLSYATYNALSGKLKATYQKLHGYRPAAPHEIVGINRKKERLAKRRKAEKAARKANHAR
jgi:hypothetical protein